MKVYCNDCRYFHNKPKSVYGELGTAQYGELFSKTQCWADKNAIKDYEKSNEYPDRIQGMWNFIDYLADVYTFKKRPEDINKNNNCKWFEILECKWWQWQKRKRLELRYSLQRT